MSASGTTTPQEPSRQDSQADWDAVEDPGFCERCGGDGYIMACEGDGDDWGEDTYAGPMDAVIKCRACNGGGLR